MSRQSPPARLRVRGFFVSAPGRGVSVLLERSVALGEFAPEGFQQRCTAEGIVVAGWTKGREVSRREKRSG